MKAFGSDLVPQCDGTITCSLTDFRVWGNAYREVVWYISLRALNLM